MRWGKPEPLEIDEYEMMNIDGTSIYVHRAVMGIVNARIDVVTGGAGTNLIFLGYAGIKKNFKDLVNESP